MGTAPHLSEAKRELLRKYLLGEVIQGALAGDRITPRPAGATAPLSLSQEQLWLREQSLPDAPPLYNECITLRMVGSVDVPVLEQSLTEIVRRHEIWRTSYDAHAGRPVQVIHPMPDRIRLPVIDLQGLPPSQMEEEALQLVGEEARRPFDLKTGPLLRFRLLRMGDAECRLFLISHLSIVDGVSVYQVFPAELAALYRHYCAGQSSPLSNLPIQYGDYAYWQRRWLEGEELARQVAYWGKQLAGELPVLQWPTDRPRPPVQTFRGAIRPFALPKALGEAAKELSQREGTTLFIVLLAAFMMLLHGYTQQEDIILGTFSPAGRRRSEVQGLLGYFLNPVALRFNLAGCSTFRELLRHAQKVTLEALSNDDVPIEFLAQQLRLKPDPSRNPFFTVAISLQPPMPELDLDWSVSSMDVQTGGAFWDLYMAFISGPGGIFGRIQYNPDLFEIEAIIRILRDFQDLLESVVSEPAQHFSEVDAGLGAR